MKLAAACLLLVFGAFSLPSHAQRAPDPIPVSYRVGEHLTYNVSFSNFISAAHVELLVAARGTFFGRDAIQLKGHVETTGVVNAALFAINNDYITYVDATTSLPFRGQQIVREASRSSETSADFNQALGTAAIPQKATEFPGTYDFLSAVYRLRAMPLQDGATYVLKVRGDRVNYELQVKATGREVIKTNVGSFNTIVTQLRVRGDSSGHSYTTKAYFSDDEGRVPVLLITKLSAGEVRAELTGSQFLTPAAAPITSQPTPVPTPSRQPPVVIPSQPVGDGEAPLQGLPFKVGEQLNYKVFLAGIAAQVGQATFQVRSRSRFFDHDGLFLTVSAQTTNAVQKLFVANDNISSYVDPATLLPFRTELSLTEGRRRFSSKLVINQDYGTASTDKGAKIEIPVGTHDYVSFFYSLRTLNIRPPRRSAVSILVDNKPKTLFISALKREKIQLGSQEIAAIQVSLTTDDSQADKFQLRAWISDDARRLPLRLTAVTELGPLRADLAIIPLTNQ
ncbi:MAG: DUF3108 domain-containing protein [Pyrinomonadaceae bacterium]